MAIVRFTQGGDYQSDSSVEAVHFQQRAYPDTESFVSLITSEGGDFLVIGGDYYDLVADEDTPANSATDGIYADFSGHAAHFNLTGGARGDVLIGSSNNDNLIGAGGDDLLVGGAAGDSFDGGEGIDTVSYASATRAVAIGGGDPANPDDATGDTFNSIEIFIGSSEHDNITTTGTAAYLGGAGNDWFTMQGTGSLEGGEGADTFFAMMFNRLNITHEHAAEGVVVDAENAELNQGDAAGDSYFGFIGTLSGSNHDDRLTAGESIGVSFFGLDGDDLLAGGVFEDLFDGGNGNDTVSYGNSIVGVQASLTHSAVNNGGAAGDTYADVENLTGSSSSDVLIGNWRANVLTGGDGNDRLVGRGGADSLIGGAGTDKLIITGNPTKIDGGADRDVLEVAAGSRVTFAAGSVTGIELVNVYAGASANLSALEASVGQIRVLGNSFTDTSVVGTQGADRIFATGGNGLSISGGAGDDVVRLTGQINANLLSGGEGRDTLVVGDTDGFSVSLSSQAFSGFEVVHLLDGASLDLDGRSRVRFEVKTITAEGVNAPVTETAVPDLIQMFTTEGGTARIRAGLGDDVIRGGAGQDYIDGGRGGDSMRGGGGADQFRFVSLDEMGNGKTGKSDIIRDFSHEDGDKIDMSSIFNQAAESNYDFLFIGAGAFSGSDGNSYEVRVEQGENGGSVVQIDINHDGAADASFLVYSDGALTRRDFVFPSDFG